MHISGAFSESKKADIQTAKADIQMKKADIQVEDVYADCLGNMTKKTIMHIQRLYDQLGNHDFFGRAEVECATELKSSRASALLKELAEASVIEPVKGHGKGKYKFRMR